MLQAEPMADSNVEADTTAVKRVKLPPEKGLAEMKDRTKRIASEIVLYADVSLNNARTQVDHL